MSVGFSCLDHPFPVVNSSTIMEQRAWDPAVKSVCLGLVALVLVAAMTRSGKPHESTPCLIEDFARIATAWAGVSLVSRFKSTYF